jgi:hypothetical protein
MTHRRWRHGEGRTKVTTMNIRNAGASAFAIASLMILAACGSDPAADAAANKADAEARSQMQSMANAADGSAAAAVGEMMSDPAIQEQLGMSTGGPKTANPTAAQNPTEHLTVVDPSPAADPSQIKALTLCHGLKAARTGDSYPMGPEADAKAAAELKADPAALATCQNG